MSDSSKHFIIVQVDLEESGELHSQCLVARACECSVRNILNFSQYIQKADTPKGLFLSTINWLRGKGFIRIHSERVQKLAYFGIRLVKISLDEEMLSPKYDVDEEEEDDVDDEGYDYEVDEWNDYMESGLCELIEEDYRRQNDHCGCGCAKRWGSH
jgi:hypothetical protein